MKTDLFKSIPAIKPDQGLSIVRVAVALVIGVHAVRGLLNPADVNDLGEYLGTLGFPLGVPLAWAVILGQFLSSIALIFRRLVVPACICHMVILGFGIWIVHASKGWFVVGHGSNGMEYSITLIACLFAVAWAHWPRKQQQ